MSTLPPEQEAARSALRMAEDTGVELSPEEEARLREASGRRSAYEEIARFWDAENAKTVSKMRDEMSDATGVEPHQTLSPAARAELDRFWASQNAPKVEATGDRLERAANPAMARDEAVRQALVIDNVRPAPNFVPEGHPYVDPEDGIEYRYYKGEIIGRPVTSRNPRDWAVVPLMRAQEVYNRMNDELKGRVPEGG